MTPRERVAAAVVHRVLRNSPTWTYSWTPLRTEAHRHVTKRAHSSVEAFARDVVDAFMRHAGPIVLAALAGGYNEEVMGSDLFSALHNRERFTHPDKHLAVEMFRAAERIRQTLSMDFEMVRFDFEDIIEIRVRYSL